MARPASLRMKRLLAGDAVEVGPDCRAGASGCRCRVDDVAVGIGDLEVAGPHVRQRGVTVERVAAARRTACSGRSPGRASRPGRYTRTWPMVVDDRLEALEVDLEVVVDR